MNVVKTIIEKKIQASTLEVLLEEKSNDSTRQVAIQAFLKQGLPNKKSEEYKYSDTTKLFKEISAQEPTTKQLPKNFSVEQFYIPNLEANTIVLINGDFVADLSKVENKISFCSIAHNSTTPLGHEIAQYQTNYFSKIADINSDPFIALNTALYTTTSLFHIPKKTVVEKPLHIIHIFTSSDPVLINPRSFIVIGEHASVNIIESTHSVSLHENAVVNTLTEIVVDKHAKATYYKLQQSDKGLKQIATTAVLQQTKSHFDTNTVTLGGTWIRNNLSIALEGERCETHLNGLFIAEDQQHIDNHTLVDHRVANCESFQLYKGILKDKSTGVFNGKIFVKKDAQKTNAYQSSKNMLLSDNATINTKPQLEIYADDVKCSHGSSTGQIDKNALFYLQARGLSADSARVLLTQAFAADVINTIKNDALAAHLEDLVEKKIASHI